MGNNNSGGTISGCYATGDATGGTSTGGLVGNNSGEISACYATGNAEATGTYGRAGGLVGNNYGGTISALLCNRECRLRQKVTAE